MWVRALSHGPIHMCVYQLQLSSQFLAFLLSVPHCIVHDSIRHHLLITVISDFFVVRRFFSEFSTLLWEDFGSPQLPRLKPSKVLDLAICFYSSLETEQYATFVFPIFYESYNGFYLRNWDLNIFSPTQWILTYYILLNLWFYPLSNVINIVSKRAQF